MGLFSSKKKRYVDTQVQRVIEDVNIPDATKNAVIESLLGEAESIPIAIQNEALNGGAQLFHRMYRYAESGDYFYGLPNASVLSNEDGNTLAETALESEVGENVTLEYLFFRPLNNIHQGWKELTDNYGYSHATNEITSLSSSKPNPVYLSKMVAVHEGAAGQEVEKNSLGTFEYSSEAGETPTRPWPENPQDYKEIVYTQEVRFGLDETESVEIHYVWLDANGELATDSIVIDLTAFGGEDEYYQAKYELDNGTVGYWTYNPRDDVHTSLTGVFDPAEVISPGTYFPFAVLRSEGIDRTTDDLKNTDEYKTTAKLLDYIGLDFAALGEDLREGSGTNQIAQSVIMMAVPIASENPIEIDYLFRYFDSIHGNLPEGAKFETNPDALPDVKSEYGLSAGRHTSYAVQITDADFELNLSFEAVIKKYVAGSIGDVGTVTNTLGGAEDISRALEYNDLDRNDITGLDPSIYRIFRKQVTSGIYVEIRVKQPKARYRIYRDKGAEGGATSELMLIPLDRSVTDEMPITHLAELYQRSLHFVFNSNVVQEIKWYQTGVFKALLFIATIAITVVTSGGGAALAAAAAAGVGALVITAINIIINAIIQNIIVSFVFTEVVEAVGIENAYWLAVAAVIVGGASALQSGGFVAKSLASNLITAANGLVTGAKNVLAGLASDLQSEIAEFRELATSQIDELNEIQKSLDSGIFLDPFEFIGKQPLTLLGESSDAYFQRTVHTANPGRESMNIIQNFVEISLRLPTLTDTAGIY